MENNLAEIIDDEESELVEATVDLGTQEAVNEIETDEDIIPESGDCGLDPEFKKELAAALAPAEQGEKPDISYLDDAIVDHPEHGAVFLAAEGDNIIIEYNELWRDTCLFNVKKIDDLSGNVMMWNPMRGQYAATNYKTGREAGQVIKLAPHGANPFKLAAALEKGKGKRKGSASKRLAIASAAPLAPGEKKRRGRRPGSKNRSPEEMAILKKERAEILAEKMRIRDLKKQHQVAVVQAMYKPREERAPKRRGRPRKR